MKIKLILIGTLGILLSTGALAQGIGIHHNEKLRMDISKLQQDKRILSIDQEKLRHDQRTGNRLLIREDKRKIQQDLSIIRADQEIVRRDQSRKYH